MAISLRSFCINAIIPNHYIDANHLLGFAVNEIPIATFAEAICNVHGVDEAIYAGRTEVQEMFGGEVVWEGEVLSFDLRGHPSAERCYCWEVDGDVTCVLDAGGVNSPVKAVRAAILASGDENG